MNNAFVPGTRDTRLARLARGAAALAGLFVASSTLAATPTDISQTPLVVKNAAQAKPNLMLLMDNSGSMGRTHMPDEAESVMGVLSVGYKSVQCNALYYNPGTTYLVPKKYDGTPFATPTFNAAPYAGYAAFFVAPTSLDTSVKNLATQFVPYLSFGVPSNATVLGAGYGPPVGSPSAGFAPATAGPAYYYSYTGPETLKYDSAPCNQLDNGATAATAGGGLWTRVVMTTQSPAQQANFAMWYTYYRTRLALTKSAASLSFLPLDVNKRVGFITVEPKDHPGDTTIDAARYLQLGDFSTVAGGQKDLWYGKLFSQIPSGASPTREGLARVGRYYGGFFGSAANGTINEGMTGPDPVQYYCQQNFTILTTDGYWNAQTESAGGGGIDLNGVLVGQQDGEPKCHSFDPLCQRPIFDGNSADIQRVTDKVNNYTNSTCPIDTLYRHTVQQQRKVYNLARDTSRTLQQVIQYKQFSSQLVATSVQTVATVKQTKRTTDQYWIETTTPTQDRYHIHKYQDNIVRDTEQYQRQTRQQTAQTLHNDEVVTYFTAHTERWQTASVQYVLNETNFKTSTTNYLEGKKQVYKYQWWYIGKDNNNEVSVHLSGSTCPSGYHDCQVVVKLPKQFVDPATCNGGVSPSNDLSPYDDEPDNSFVHTECTNGPNTSAYQPVLNCSSGVTPGTPDPATSGNSFTVTTCNVTTSTPDFAPGYTTATCLPFSQITGTPFTITTCTPSLNTSTPQATACSSTVDVGSPYTRHDCVQPSLTNYAARDSAPCNELAPPYQDPGTFVTTTCTKPEDHTDPAPQAGFGCTSTDGMSSPYVKTTCLSSTPVTTAKSFFSCSAAPASYGNGYRKTDCNRTAGGPTPAVTAVQFGTCVQGPDAPGLGYTYDTYCDNPAANNQTKFVDAATCSNSTYNQPGSGDPWIDVICTRPVSTTGDPWNPAAGTCPEDTGLTGPLYLRSHCYVVPGTDFGYVDETTCTQTTSSISVSPFTTTHCIHETLGGAFTCPGNTPSGPPWIYEVCGSNLGRANTGFGSCTLGSPVGGDPTTLCGHTVQTLPIDVCSQDLSPSGTNPQVTCAGPTVVAALSGAVDPATLPGSQGQQGGPDYYDVTWVTNPAGMYATPAGVSACPTPPMDSSFVVTTCGYPTATNFTDRDAAPCTDGPVIPGDNTNDYTTTQCVKHDDRTPVQGSLCQTVGQTGTGPQKACLPDGGNSMQPVDSCHIGDTDGGSPYDTTTMCYSNQASAPFLPYGPALCVNGSSGTVGQEYECQSPPQGSDVADAGCSASGPDSNGIIVSCPHITGSGYKYQVSTATTVTTTPLSGGVPSGAAVTNSSATTPTDVDGMCYPAMQTIPSALFPAAPVDTITGCGPGWPCTENFPSPGGSSNSLADVAQYYYTTNLRPAFPIGVPPAGTGPEDDTVTHQHMTTFVVALGVSGTLQYRPDYKSTAVVTGDFAKIRAGTLDWPVWPDPLNYNYSNVDNYENPKSIDDFWHTAVDGRGRFFSANDPTTVVQGLSDALAKAGAITAAGAADAVSSLTPVAGNNFVYASSYESGTWSGDLQAYTLNLTSGDLVLPKVWSAKDLLDTRTFANCDNRKIWLLRGNALVDFAQESNECGPTGSPSTHVVGTLTPAELANFSSSNIALLSQFTAYSPTDPQLVAAQQPGILLNFLRGQRGNEDYVTDSLTQLFRKRSAVLGDLVDSQPVYVGQPFANYVDSGYTTFKGTARPSMVYVGGNDGMVHAFNASVTATNGGQEAWAVVPSSVLPKMYELADIAYTRGNHEFFVDGTPVAADIFAGGTWHTILVGGLNAGGKGYYALDITNPASPGALWEFKQNPSLCPAAVGDTSDCNMGLSFGKPVVTKLGSQWVVMFTSGYNNINSVAGDGQGFLYVVDAFTGGLVYKIATGVGSSSAPAGLAQINNYVDNVLINNLTLRAYGTDLLGNVWRFEFGGTPKAVLVGTAKTTGGIVQPITTRPELAELNGEPFLMVGTGELLGDSDVLNAQVQSVYAFNDHVTAEPTAPTPVYTSLRASLRTLTMTTSGTPPTAVRTIACTANCTLTDGWVVNLPEAATATTGSERVNVDMKLVLGTLAFASNVPEGDACKLGGHSWFNQVDFRTGLAVSTAPLQGGSGIISNYLADTLTEGLTIVQLPATPGNNNGTFETLARQSDGSRRRPTTYVATPPFVGKRISWREIVQ